MHPGTRRDLARIFLSLPGFVVWVSGCLVAGSAGTSLVAGTNEGEWLKDLLYFTGGFVVALVGHGMLLASRIFSGDRKLRFVGSHLGEMMAWDAVVQLTGILLATAAWGAAFSFSSGQRLRTALALPVLAALVGTFRHLVRKRRARHQRWQEEVAALESERARMEAEMRSMTEGAAAPEKP